MTPLRAGVVDANRRVTLQDLIAAEREARGLRQLNAADAFPLVMNEELLLSKIRLQELYYRYLKQEEVEVSAAMVDPDPVLKVVQDLTAKVDEMKKEIKNELGEIKQKQQELSEDMDKIKQKQQEISNIYDTLSKSVHAKIDNQQIKHYNCENWFFEHEPIRPLKKFTAGFGSGLPGCPVSEEDLPLAFLAIGAVVPDHIFPSKEDLLDLNLSEEKLSEISAIYNDDFGIVATDPLNIRKRKFRDFVRH